jgi:hypothetical protein
MRTTETAIGTAETSVDFQNLGVGVGENGGLTNG